MELSEFWTICSSNGIILDMEQIHSIERYHKEVIYWNEKVNLVSRRDASELLSRHILHSITILKYFDFKKKARCLDVGTGGGLPGIPLKIVRPDLDMVLIDSIAKKVKIADMLARHTGLKKIKAVCERAEMFSEKKENFEVFDIVVSRAVSKIDKIISWVHKSLVKDGKVVLLKGGDLTEEIIEAKNSFKEINIKEININFNGADWFAKDNKKIVVCSNIK